MSREVTEESRQEFKHMKQFVKQRPAQSALIILELKEALKFYADEKSYQDYDDHSPGTSDVMSDFGRKAKSALEETK